MEANTLVGYIIIMTSLKTLSNITWKLCTRNDKDLLSIESIIIEPPSLHINACSHYQLVWIKSEIRNDMLWTVKLYNKFLYVSIPFFALFWGTSEVINHHLLHFKFWWLKRTYAKFNLWMINVGRQLILCNYKGINKYIS